MFSVCGEEDLKAQHILLFELGARQKEKQPLWGVVYGRVDYIEKRIFPCFLSHKTQNRKWLNLAQVPVESIIFAGGQWGQNGKPFCVSCSMKPIGKQEEVRLPWRW